MNKFHTSATRTWKSLELLPHLHCKWTKQTWKWGKVFGCLPSEADWSMSRWLQIGNSALEPHLGINGGKLLNVLPCTETRSPSNRDNNVSFMWTRNVKWIGRFTHVLCAVKVSKHNLFTSSTFNLKIFNELQPMCHFEDEKVAKPRNGKLTQLGVLATRQYGIDRNLCFAVNGGWKRRVGWEPTIATTRQYGIQETGRKEQKSGNVSKWVFKVQRDVIWMPGSERRHAASSRSHFDGQSIKRLVTSNVIGFSVPSHWPSRCWLIYKSFGPIVHKMASHVLRIIFSYFWLDVTWLPRDELPWVHIHVY